MKQQPKKSRLSAARKEKNQSDSKIDSSVVSMSYKELKDKHRQEVNGFPMFFAFCSEQFATVMAKFGLTPSDTDKVMRLDYSGGLVLKTDAPRLLNMWNRQKEECRAAITADTKGDGYIYQMFLYELDNHEYGYTGELTDALAVCDLTMEDVLESKPLLAGLKMAIEEIRNRP
ncbi:MAG: hypothetical protein FWB74_08145 [Defluviitaleaceae bacterium]|nr:hypothetical protein [Defluviitaleaceae bacterium]